MTPCQAAEVVSGGCGAAVLGAVVAGAGTKDGDADSHPAIRGSGGGKPRPTAHGCCVRSRLALPARVTADAAAQGDGRGSFSPRPSCPLCRPLLRTRRSAPTAVPPSAPQRTRPCRSVYHRRRDQPPQAAVVVVLPDGAVRSATSRPTAQMKPNSSRPTATTACWDDFPFLLTSRQ